MKDSAKRQALLPEEMEGHTIGGMMHGEIAYTVPWAMYATHDRHLWLIRNYTVSSQPGGTCSMRVERQADGYHVWRPAGHRYSLEPNGEVVIADVPVAELHS